MTRWKTIPAVIGFIVVAYGGLLLAQTQQPPPPPQGGQPSSRDPRMEQMIDMMFRDMDTNHDGKISKSEWMSFYEKQFDKLDKNAKGYLTKGDIRADMTARMRAQQQQQKQAPPQ